MNTMTTNNLTFTTREECVATLKQWKQEYKELSQQIRESKCHLKEQQRKGMANSGDFSLRLSLKAKATAMLEYREQHKDRSRQIWNA